MKYLFILFLLIFNVFIIKAQESTSCCSGKKICAKEIIQEREIEERGCNGSMNCRVCKNCNYCSYCNSGGSCGVCSGGYKTTYSSGGYSNSSYSKNSSSYKKSTSEYYNNSSYNNKTKYTNSALHNLASYPLNNYKYAYYESAKVIARELNLRTGPSTNYSKILLLTRGDKLIVLGDETQQPGGELFIKVKYGSVTGYVAKRFIK